MKGQYLVQISIFSWVLLLGVLLFQTRSSAFEHDTSFFTSNDHQDTIENIPIILFSKDSANKFDTNSSAVEEQRSTYGKNTAAGTKNDTVVLDRLLVSARLLNEFSGSVTKLHAADFQGRYADLPAVLEQVSGLTVRRTGTFGEYTDVSMRGTSAKQVQVFLDGVLLNSASGGAVDLSKIPLNSLQKIDIYKGAAPIELMGNAAGGVINLVTDPGKGVISGTTELGSFGYRKAGALLQKNSKKITHRLSVDYGDADNDYTYRYNPTPQDPDNEKVIKKINNAYTASTVTYSPSVNLSERNSLKATVSLSKYRKEFHLPYLADDWKKQQTRQNQTGVQASGVYLHDLSEKVYTKVEIKGSVKKDLLEDPVGNYYLAGVKQLQDYFYWLQLSSAAHFLITKHFSVHALLNGSYETFSRENLLIKESGNKLFAERWSANGIIETAFDFPAPFHGALRYNHVYTRDSANFRDMALAPVMHEDVFNNHYPNVNAEVFGQAFSWLGLYSDVRYEYLPITFYDRYGTGDRFIGNSNLRPEKKLEWSILGLKSDLQQILRARGIGFDRINCALDCTGYLSKIRDKIYWRPQSQQLFVSCNDGSIAVRGFEINSMIRLNGTKRFFDYCQLNQSFSVTDAIVCSVESGDPSSVGTTPSYEPKYQSNWRAIFVFPYVTLGHRATCVSGYYISINNANWKDGHTLLNAFISLTPGSRITLTYRIDNYLNVQDEFYFETAQLPGRSHYFIGQITF